jgi:hypothetical protein
VTKVTNLGLSVRVIFVPAVSPETCNREAGMQ